MAKQSWWYLWTLLCWFLLVEFQCAGSDEDNFISDGGGQIKYRVIAAGVVRPNTVYKVIFMAWDCQFPVEATAVLSLSDRTLYSNSVSLTGTMVPGTVLLKVPSNSDSEDDDYTLTVVGEIGAGLEVFRERRKLEFRPQFLTVIISTNKVIYNGKQPVRMRIIMLTTEGLPYQGTADLFILDPNDFVVRKWNSQHLNVGVLSKKFTLPLHPKLGFWTIKVVSEGQTETKKIKVEKFFLPRAYELVVASPAFALSSDEMIKASVEGTFITERIAKGNISISWKAKKFDGLTPAYNNTVLYKKKICYLCKASPHYFKREGFDPKNSDDVVLKNFDSKKKYGYVVNPKNTRENKKYVEVANIYRKISYRKKGIRNYDKEKKTDKASIDAKTNKSSSAVTSGGPIKNQWTLIRKDFRPYVWDSDQNFDPFTLYMSEVEATVGDTKDVLVRVEASMTEYFYNKTEYAFADIWIVKPEVKVKFLGEEPFVFKPGMTFQGAIAVMYEDFVSLSSAELSNSWLRLTVKAILDGGSIVTIHETDINLKAQEAEELSEEGIPTVNIAKSDYSTDFDDLSEMLFTRLSFKALKSEFLSSGILRFFVNTIPEDATELRLLAKFGSKNKTYQAEVTAYAAQSRTGNHIQITVGRSVVLSIGSYATFHISLLSPVATVVWVIIAKDIIVNQGTEVAGNHNPLTFSVVVSREMSPSFTIIAMAVDGQDILADSLHLPLSSFTGSLSSSPTSFSSPIEFATNQIKDHNMLSVEVTCRGDPGAIFLSSTMRTSMFSSQGHNILSFNNVLEAMHQFDSQRNKRSRLARTFLRNNREDKSSKMLYLPSYSHEAKAYRLLRSIGLFSLTNSNENSSNKTKVKSACNFTLGELPCLWEADGGCFVEDQICDGKEDCDDGYDERYCEDEAEEYRGLLKRYLLTRQSRFEDFYDIGDGDWGWFETNVDEDGEQFLTLEIPETPDDFYFHTFTLSMTKGVGMLYEPTVYSTTRPVDFYCEAPERIKRGESIGVLCIILNRQPNDFECSVTLGGSDKYGFIHVESYGYVTSYAPRITRGQDVTHYMHLRGGTEKEVRVPVAISAQEGDVDIEIQISSQLMSLSRTVTVTVVPEGGLVQRHTSVLLDLKNRANVFRFLNVIVDETPLIPYEVFRRYVAGSPKGYFIVSGDVVGPIFPKGKPVTFTRAFPTGNGRVAKGTHRHAFNLGINTWQLHYLRLTNQLTQTPGLLRKVLERINAEYAAILRRFSAKGWLTNWNNSSPSVWLTAWVLKLFSHASFQDWEDLLYIDPEVVTSGVRWLLNYQTSSGSFLEFDRYRQNPLHFPMRDKNNTDDEGSLALTAHVLITLEETEAMLKGSTVSNTSMAIRRAVGFLERHLSQIHNLDTFEVCILTYALTLSRSTLSGQAYDAMMGRASEEGSMLYWSTNNITTNRVRYEFNRPFLEAKEQQDGDAVAVEATSYALLAIFQTEGGGITFIQDKIVEWLNSMRLGEGGFISMVDTLVAVQALVMYSYHSRIKDITDLTVSVDFPSSNTSKDFHIMGDANIARGHRFDLTNVWGHMNIFAHGAGQAVGQLDLTYGVDYEPFRDHPPTDSFRLKLQENYGGRNKSEIMIRACFSWTLTSENPRSAMALLTVDKPSGYIIEQVELNRVVHWHRKSGAVPELMDASALVMGKTVFYMESVPNATRCISYTVKRYYPVANMTRTRQAVLMEPLRPSRFVTTTFNSTSLYILSICEVCGSFQCPYCPFYSSAAQHSLSLWTIMLIIIVQLPLRGTNK